MKVKLRGKQREWSREDASNIDGQTERSKWAGAHESKCGQRASFNGATGVSDPAAAGASEDTMERLGKAKWKARPRWVAARMEPRGREQHRWANREVEVSGST
jgi:hypothetical protein